MDKVAFEVIRSPVGKNRKVLIMRRHIIILDSSPCGNYYRCKRVKPGQGSGAQPRREYDTFYISAHEWNNTDLTQFYIYKKVEETP